MQRGFVDKYEPRGSGAGALRLTGLWVTGLWVGEVIPLQATAESMWMWVPTSEDAWVKTIAP